MWVATDRTDPPPLAPREGAIGRPATAQRHLGPENEQFTAGGGEGKQTRLCYLVLVHFVLQTPYMVMLLSTRRTGGGAIKRRE